MTSDKSTGEIVLYVDDDESNLDVFEATFSEEFEVLTATSGADGLTLLEQHEVAVLLVDQRMPEMTGTELAEIAMVRWPDTVRLLVTAFADLTAAMDAINQGQVRRFMRKPWNQAELRAALVDGIDSFRAKRRIQELETRLVSVERIYGLGVVAASIAHELRNPMSVVCGTVPIVIEDLEALAAKRRDEGAYSAHVEGIVRDLKDIHRAGDMAVEIMRGIERSSRRDATEPSSVNLADIVRTTIAMVRGKLRRQATYEVELEAVPPILGTEVRVSQVALNLITNAIEALPATRAPKENHIAVRLKAANGDVMLEVEDNAGGISEDVMAKVFDPFFTTKENSGTGLGLAISKQIVEELSGTLTVSNTGHGACFRVVFPALR